MIDPADYSEGDRVRAVNFVLDEGLRIWPIDNGKTWRVVRVADQAVQEELFRGGQLDCQAKYPDATFGINDNESVPPGTEGVVDHVSDSQLGVTWANGRRLMCVEKDTIERL